MKSNFLTYIVSIIMIIFCCSYCEKKSEADDEKVEKLKKQKEKNLEEKELEKAKKLEYEEEKKKFLLREAEWEKKDADRRAKSDQDFKKKIQDGWKDASKEFQEMLEKTFREFEEEEAQRSKLLADKRNKISSDAYDLHEDALKSYIDRQNDKINSLSYLFQQRNTPEELEIKKDLEDTYRASKAEAEQELEEVRRKRAAAGF